MSVVFVKSDKSRNVHYLLGRHLSVYNSLVSGMTHKAYPYREIHCLFRCVRCVLVQMQWLWVMTWRRSSSWCRSWNAGRHRRWWSAQTVFHWRSPNTSRLCAPSCF